MKILNSVKNKKIDLTFSFQHSLNDTEITFYSCNFSLVKDKEEFIINFRCVNYVTEPSFQMNGIQKFITINVMVKYDKNFQVLTQTKVLPKITSSDNVRAFYGVEDIRLFNFHNKILFTGAVAFDRYMDPKNGIMCGNYHEYVDKNKLHVTAYKDRQKVEKNWVYFENKSTLHVIYQWDPLTICEIEDKDGQNELINVKKININSLKDLRGSTNGVHYKNEIWFIAHKTVGGIRSFEHYFVVFDSEMHLLRVSEPFKFEDKIREYCICLYIEEDNVFIGYSIDDNSSILNIYKMEDLLHNILFYSE